MRVFLPLKTSYFSKLLTNYVKTLILPYLSIVSTLHKTLKIY